MAKRKSYTVTTHFTIGDVKMSTSNTVWKAHIEEAKQIQREWILCTKKNPVIAAVIVKENRSNAN